MTMKLGSKVTLIPWDGDSEAHREWLVRQRVECTWDHEKVQTKWRNQQRNGEKCIFWIVSFEALDILFIGAKGRAKVLTSRI
jgi:hypothetical protein